MMSSPTQALVWKCWATNRKALLLVQVLVIALSSVFIITVADPNTPEAPDVIINALIFVGLLVLFATTSTIPSKESMYRFSVGFPFKQEFVLPVSTTRLTLVPVFFYCLLMVVAYCLPLFVLNFLLGVGGPQIEAVFMVVQTTLLFTAVSWFTTNSRMQAAAWLLLLFLYYQGYIYPDFTVTEGSVDLTLHSLESVFIQVLITASYVLVLFAGVRRQRYGENLLGHTSRQNLLEITAASGLPIAASDQPCPVDTPTGAQWWRESKVRGLKFSLVTGAFAGLVILTLSRVIVVMADPPEPWSLRQLSALAMGMYFMYFCAVHAQSYGIRFKNGRGSVGLLDRLVPMNTAKLNLIQNGSVLLSCAMGAMVILVTVSLFGGFFIDDFGSVRSEAIELAMSYVDQSPLVIGAGTIMFLANFVVASLVFSSINAASVISPWVLFRLTLGAVFYGLGLLLLAYLLAGRSGLEAMIERFIRWHIWLFISGGMALTVYVYRYCFREKVLDISQIATIAALSILVWLVFLYNLINKGFYQSGYSVAVVAGNTMWGLALFLAIGLSLWTVSMLRHR